MSTNMAVLNASQLPASIREAMVGVTQNELTENVGANYPVLSIKGRAFKIKHNSEETQLTIQYQGQTYAAPNFDAVIIAASPVLSKTYYPTGYTEGSDDKPTCWSEDSITPLAPLENRPLDVHGQKCTDCRLCPMNAFGSKVSTDAAGSNAKACADTRKIILAPTKQVGADAAGNPIIAVDVENPRYGGPMLLRVPADSLKIVAEYGRKLQAMGVPFWSAVTRFTFDQSVAYPKLVLEPLRVVNEAEGVDINEARKGPQVEAILRGGHATAALTPPPPQQIPQQAAPPPVPVGAPVAEPVVAQPIVPPAPVQAAPAQPAPVQAVQPAPVQPATAPMPAPAIGTATPVVPAGVAPPVPAAAQAAPAQAASPVVSADLLGRIDQMLAT